MATSSSRKSNENVRTEMTPLRQRGLPFTSALAQSRPSLGSLHLTLPLQDQEGSPSSLYARARFAQWPGSAIETRPKGASIAVITEDRALAHSRLWLGSLHQAVCAQ